MSSQVNADVSAVHSLRFAHAATERLVSGFDEAQLCSQEGPCINHPLWVLGHLAATDDYFLNQFGGRDSLALPEHWHKLFGMDSTPGSDPSEYPSADEIRAAWKQRREALIEWIESLTLEQLSEATEENWQAYAPTVGHLAHFIAWHEAYHGGQISVHRKSLGLGRAFG